MLATFDEFLVIFKSALYLTQIYGGFSRLFCHLEVANFTSSLEVPLNL